MHAANVVSASLDLSHLAYTRTVTDEEPRPLSFRQQVGVALSRVQDLRGVKRAVAPLDRYIRSACIATNPYFEPFPALSGITGIPYDFIDG